MPLPDLILESKFEEDLYDAAWRGFDLENLQLESASWLFEALRPLEDKLLFIILGAVHFSAFDDDNGHQYFIAQIQSELERRVTFIEEMRRQMRTCFTEKIRSIEEGELRRREQACASS